MPDLKSVKLSDAVVGSLVEVGSRELVPVKADGVAAVEMSEAVAVVAREAVVMAKTFNVAGLEARRAELMAELERVNAILASVGR